ncbi:dihydrofolate reductase family protein [Flavitalea flava]
MRNLILQVQISVDGFIADKNGKTDWMLWNWGEYWTWDLALQQYQKEVTGSVDTVLLSRKMAEEGFIHHWAAVSEKKDNPQAGFAMDIRKAQKVVLTKTLSQSTWDNTVLAKGDLTEEVTRLKRANGRNIIVYGGATFLSSLIKSGLIDEFHLIINPSVLGSGLRIFHEVSHPLNLTLITSRAYPCGIVVLKYKPV